MVYAVERTFYNVKVECLGWSYQNYDDELRHLIYQMRDKTGHPSIGEEYRNLRFFMNLPLYREFTMACQMSCHKSDMYRGIRIIPDPTLRVGDSQSICGIVRLTYEEPEIKYNKCFPYDIKALYPNFIHIDAKPHIDHVKFNGPATIVFWKDGTKTVVKHDGRGRKDKRLAVLYAFMRKIYGEGRPYHNILNEIEEAIK